MHNIALNRWRDGLPSYGAWINLPDIHVTETLARLGTDWLCFDLQHGLMDYRDLTQLLPAISGLEVTPLVRVAANQPDQIGKALDIGVHGVIVPMVNGVEDAARAASACRYPPNGSRSVGPMRCAMLEGLGYLATANSQVACIPMIETEEGLANVEAIAAVEGVDALFIGPMDLCFGLGLPPGSFADPVFTAAIERIKAACKAAGIAVGMFGYNAEMAAQSIEAGFQFVSIGTDISFFRSGAQQAFATARGEELAEAARGGY